MPPREAATCARCRDSKRRCDKAKPSCSRCTRAGVPCYYDIQHKGDICLASIDATPTLSSDVPSITSLRSSASGNERQYSGPERATKRRNRACLSCTRCHRLKIKCDKKQPCCSRCARSGHGRTCIYTHSVQIDQPVPTTSFALTADDSEIVVASWFLRKRGPSHWKVLLSRLDSPSFTDLGFEWLPMAVKEHMDGDCSSDLALPGNFPFGSPETARYPSIETIHTILHNNRSESRRYLDRYIGLFHAAIPMFNLNKFQAEIERFWDAPDKSDIGWLAQYLAVLGLGALTCHGEEKRSAEYFFASEACLAKTPYMFRPNVTNIRTLCLLVVAKQVAYFTCWALDACWIIMGIIVRLSLMITLHEDFLPGCDLPNIAEEREERRHLWNTVVFLDIQMSLITGHMSLLPYDSLPAICYLRSDTTVQDCWASTLPASFSVISHFLARINSSSGVITYNEVLQYDIEVRQLMHDAKKAEVGEIQRITVDVFFRRILLVLHRRHALDPDAATLYPTSYWSSLECSLALIVHHGELTDVPHLHGLQLPENAQLIARPYILDFFAAALTTCIHLLSINAQLVATVESEGMIPPRQTILDTLKASLDIFAKEKFKSVCFSTGYQLLAAVYGLLPRE